MAEFVKYPKMPRVNNVPVTITEKLDGTNACVTVIPVEAKTILAEEHDPDPNLVYYGHHPRIHDEYVGVWVQSRKRFINPSCDNAGFAQWVANNAPILVDHLGAGRHYGEWVGTGIQRGYQRPKTFALFEPWKYDSANWMLDNLNVVPTVWTGDMLQLSEGIDYSLGILRDHGSFWGEANPEGIVVNLTNGVRFKLILNDDGTINETPKGIQ